MPDSKIYSSIAQDMSVADIWLSRTGGRYQTITIAHLIKNESKWLLKYLSNSNVTWNGKTSIKNSSIWNTADKHEHKYTEKEYVIYLQSFINI